MTADRALKQRVRARARRTGESYTAALRHIRSPGGETVPTTDHSPALLRLAVAQTTFRTDPGDARAFQEAGAEVRRLMRDAHAAGADVLQLPEATLCFPDKWSLSRERDRLTEADWSRFDWASAESAIDEIRATARSLRLWTVLGAQQRHPSDPAARPSSSLLVIDPGGTVSARYDERLLSRSKQAYLYAAGAAGVVIDVHGVRLGLASGLEALFPQVFSDYESQDVDCVLFSTAGPGDATEADTLASSVRTHALQNGLWIGYAVPSDKAPYAAAGVIAPGGAWAARCPSRVSPAIAVAEITTRPDHPGRAWRRELLGLPAAP
jgi:predicted amidohydrolase